MLKTVSLVTFALLAFAGNSVLCRIALKGDAIDAASFTSIRLFSGIIFLIILVSLKNKNAVNFKKGNWLTAGFLFLYALAFSYSYISIDAGTGALILFGTVQVTMIIYNLFTGHKLAPLEWLGLMIAFSGLLLFLLPGASSPSLIGFALMVISGIAWAFYTLAGRASKTPLMDTTNNFLRTLPFLAVVTLLTYNNIEITNHGIVLAIISGAVTSGLGYAIWYAALTGLTVTQAAIIQLTVPIIAAFGGVLFANEAISFSLILSSALVLGGVLVVILTPKSASKKPN